MGLANAYIVNWDAKYHYNFWRPVTAIRNGDQDGNDATERDAGWTSFNPTPMHPEYPSQATINATIASAVLKSVFGPVKAISFTATDVRDPEQNTAVRQPGRYGRGTEECPRLGRRAL